MKMRNGVKRIRRTEEDTHEGQQLRFFWRRISGRHDTHIHTLSYSNLSNTKPPNEFDIMGFYRVRRDAEGTSFAV